MADTERAEVRWHEVDKDTFTASLGCLVVGVSKRSKRRAGQIRHHWEWHLSTRNYDWIRVGTSRTKEMALRTVARQLAERAAELGCGEAA